MSPAEAYIDQQPHPAREIMTALHQFILTYPGVSSRISFGVPFYYGNTWICYLNTRKKGGVELAFIRANELKNESGILDFRGRKQVAGIVFHSAADIAWEPLDRVLQQALTLDATQKYSVRKKK